MSSDNKIRIMVVEDHPLFREGLRRVAQFEEDLEIVAEASDGEEAIRRAQELKPDIIMMDINLPKLNGLQATRQILAEWEEARIIVLTAYHDDEQQFHALRAGAAAYFPKDTSPDVILKAIRAVHEGKYVIGDTIMTRPQLMSWLVNKFEELAVFDEGPEDMFTPLSPREMEILVLVARGASNKEIARALSISRQTVKNHMSSILRKLGVSDRTQATVLALRRGWIRLEDTRPLEA
jgi:DNA-binding NarL/FixJ family response regulator